MKTSALSVNSLVNQQYAVIDQYRRWPDATSAHRRPDRIAIYLKT